jgi:hypothetical protein
MNFSQIISYQYKNFALNSVKHSSVAKVIILMPTQPPIQWVPGALSLGVKQLGHEAYHLSPSSAKVKNVWSYTPTPHYVFMAWCLVKHRDNFTFTLLFNKLVMDLGKKYPVTMFYLHNLGKLMIIFWLEWVVATHES